MKGTFITFEGIEGSGKSTQVELLCRELARRGREVVCTREPGGTALGRSVRSLLLDPSNRGLAAGAELFLYLADRCQHTAERVGPALERGMVVVCDRWADASVAYQGYGRGVEIERIREWNRFATRGIRPQVTILLDLPAETGLARARARNRALGTAGREDRFEEEELAFHERVRRGYLELARREPGRFQVVDAAPGAAQTHRRILSLIEPLLQGGAAPGGR